MPLSERERRQCAPRPIGWPKGHTDRHGMSSQNKRDCRKRPCPWSLKQCRSLSCCCLQASAALTVIPGWGTLLYRGPECEAGRRHGTDGYGHKEIIISVCTQYSVVFTLLVFLLFSHFVLLQLYTLICDSPTVEIEWKLALSSLRFSEECSVEFCPF